MLVVKDLDHPGLVKYHDLFLEPLQDKTVGVCFIMDLFTEGDLGKYLYKRKKKNKFIPVDVSQHFITKKINFFLIRKLLILLYNLQLL